MNKKLYGPATRLRVKVSDYIINIRGVIPVVVTLVYTEYRVNYSWLNNSGVVKVVKWTLDLACRANNCVWRLATGYYPHFSSNTQTCEIRASSTHREWNSVLDIQEAFCFQWDALNITKIRLDDGGVCWSWRSRACDKRGIDYYVQKSSFIVVQCELHSTRTMAK